jgi:NDP-sugar pyrophosphorylase family protein
LVPVLGRPFLEHQIKLVREAGVERLVLCIGHYGEQIVERFGDGSAYGVEIAYSQEGEQLLGTGGALKKAEHLLDDAFMMMWGDSYLLLDYADIWKAFQAQDLPAMMVVYRNENQRVPSNVVVQDGKVSGI